MSKTPEQFDVMIIGGGPAGLAAALYTARDRYSTLILEKNGLPGGQILFTERIENYPGYLKISGADLVENMRRQVEAFGAKLKLMAAATAIRKLEGGLLEVEVNGGEFVCRAKAIILSPGSDYRRLNVPGEEEMRQAGKVSFCATCDGAFYRDKHILTIGGGNTAVEDTIYLATRFARQVTMIHRRKEFRAQQVLVEELYATARQKGLDIKLPYVLDRIVPTADKTQVDHVVLRNIESGQAEDLRVDGVFVFVGMVPNTSWLKGIVQLNEHGYIVCDPTTLKTSVPGIFVAGDCRQQAAMQLATACGDGVVAAMMFKEYLRNPRSWPKAMPKDGAVEGW